MSHSFWSTAALTLITALAPPAVAAAQSRTFTIRDDGGSRIQFISDAPLETTTGVTSSVTGEVTMDPAHLAAARGRVAVQMSTIHTGIDLRDEHLRSSNWLDATQFPQATLEITSVDGATALTPGQVARVRIHGHFTLHGHTHDIIADAQVRLIPASDELRAAHVDGDALRAQATFHISLADYGVSIPSIVQLKVADDIEVNVTIRGVAPHA